MTRLHALAAFAALTLRLPTAMLITFAAGFAFAGEAAAPATSPWVGVLMALLPLVIGALVLLHPLLKLAAWLHAMAQDASKSAMAKAALLGAESIAKSLDHFLETNAQDAKDLADPAKRAAAFEHLKKEAVSGALPAAATAAAAMGATWLSGAASQAIDAAVEKDAGPPKP